MAKVDICYVNSQFLAQFTDICISRMLMQTAELVQQAFPVNCAPWLMLSYGANL